MKNKSISKRVIRNTGYLYAKMIISIIIVLLSTRIVLNALGVHDFGIFTLVGGVISSLAFLSSAMATSTQRYLSYYIGKRDIQKTNTVFKSAIVLHLALGLLVSFVLLGASFFLFDGFLNIEADRIDAAKDVFYFLIVSMFFTINAVPFDGLINSHEDLFFDAGVGVFEVVLKLLIAIMLQYSEDIDRLILYGGLMAGLMVLIYFIKGYFCYKKYDECRKVISTKNDIILIKDMSSFIGWNMFGALSGIARNQGLAIILNLFYGTIVNAAFGVANQVNNQLTAFSHNMLKALNPQIVKSEGEGNREQMLNLSMQASKFGFFLLAFFAIPLIFEMPFVLKLWLKTVPEHTVIFCRLVLVFSLVNQTTVGLQTAIQSTGRIKGYQIMVGGILIMNLPVAWLLLSKGFPAYSVMVSAVFAQLIACMLRIFFLHRIAGLCVKEYIINVLMKIILVFIFTFFEVFIVHKIMPDGFFRLLVISIMMPTVFLVQVFYLAFNNQERNFLINIFKK